MQSRIFSQRWISENGIFSQRWISENGIFSTKKMDFAENAERSSFQRCPRLERCLGKCDKRFTSGDFSVWIGTVPLYSFPTFSYISCWKRVEGNTWYTWCTWYTLCTYGILCVLCVLRKHLVHFEKHLGKYKRGFFLVWTFCTLFPHISYISCWKRGREVHDPTSTLYSFPNILYISCWKKRRKGTAIQTLGALRKH